MSSLLAESQIIPARAKDKGLTRCFVYNGPSMCPTFRTGQLLYVRPVARDIAQGDVIVFANPDGDGFVAHRVVTTGKCELVTRGDNNPVRDNWRIAPDQIIGKVELLEQEGRFKSVWGGRRGLAAALCQRGLTRLDSSLRRSLGLPYRWLRRSELVRGLLLRLIAPRFEYVTFQTRQGLVVKVFHRGHVVAKWFASVDWLQCQKPYDLVLRRQDISVGQPRTDAEASRMDHGDG